MQLKLSMKNVALALLCTVFLYPALLAQKAEFTEQDKEAIKETKANTEDLKNRMTRVETKLEETEKRLDQKIEALEKKTDSRFDSLQNLIYIVIAGIFGLIGFIVWDRATANAPFKKRQEDLEEKENKLEKALQDFARKNAEMAESLKSVGL